MRARWWLEHGRLRAYRKELPEERDPSHYGRDPLAEASLARAVQVGDGCLARAACLPEPQGSPFDRRLLHGVPDQDFVQPAEGGVGHSPSRQPAGSLPAAHAEVVGRVQRELVLNHHAQAPDVFLEGLEAALLAPGCVPLSRVDLVQRAGGVAEHDRVAQAGHGSPLKRAEHQLVCPALLEEVPAQALDQMRFSRSRLADDDHQQLLVSVEHGELRLVPVEGLQSGDRRYEASRGLLAKPP